ncbi:hypothetical protein PVAP13_8NG263001 [Panicum virgatum]|uniref:Uncharacterized protein n=1 Tax=Panicum virgatum TaxID=38727 RepID=A0A8T0PEN1_PANVG|nr:hypothetical protein PVAP13_8NG263001 [Panicum virgatum]
MDIIPPPPRTPPHPPTQKKASASPRWLDLHGFGLWSLSPHARAAASGLWRWCRRLCFPPGRHKRAATHMPAAGVLVGSLSMEFDCLEIQPARSTDFPTACILAVSNICVEVAGACRSGSGLC